MRMRTFVPLTSLGLCVAGFALNAAAASAQSDPRVGLHAGWWDAQQAARNMTLVGSGKKAEGFYNPVNAGDFGFLNGDLAFKGNIIVQGGFHGIQVWDVSDPHNPRLRSTFACPGGQGDPTLYRNLLFFSVEETRGRIDCAGQGVQDTVSKERFRGVRIFDVSDIDHPKQVAAVQTCRGSHTHTLVADPKDSKNVYIYVSGTAGVRSPNELAGCSDKMPEQDPKTSLFRIDVIKVPLDHPQDAKVVSNPRIFADAAGNVAGLWKGGAHGEGTQSTNVTDQCHDITVYSAIGMAAGACSGNGLLLDIRDPANPKRLDAAADPNFAYWHSATFSNDGKKVLFSDEWGGGVAPKCRASDNPKWGADAIFTIDHGKMTQKGYFKLPAPQTDQENCVAHNGSLIPVPGRDILAQGWYQGGVSDLRLHRSVESEGDRVLRPRSDGFDEALPERILGRVLVQRLDLRFGDRPRDRHLRAQAERVPVAKRDRRCKADTRRPAQRAEPAALRVAGEHRRAALVSRSIGAEQRSGRRQDHGRARCVEQSRVDEGLGAECGAQFGRGEVGRGREGGIGRGESPSRRRRRSRLGQTLGRYNFVAWFWQPGELRHQRIERTRTETSTTASVRVRCRFSLCGCQPC